MFQWKGMSTIVGVSVIYRTDNCSRIPQRTRTVQASLDDSIVTSGAHTTEWGDLTTCQDGTPRDFDPSNQRTNYKLSYRGSATKTLVRFLRIYNKRNIQI